MIKSFLKTAWRNIKGNTFYSIINISGLACGLATAILLLLWVEHERSYDRQHTDYHHIHRVLAHFKSSGNEIVWDGIPGPISVLSKSIPEVASIVRINDWKDQVMANTDHTHILDGFHIAWVDLPFFSLFDFNLIKGNRRQLFPNNNSVVVTQTTGRKLFGSGPLLGKTLQFQGKQFTITGVLADFPHNSSIQFDALFPMGDYAQSFTERGGNGDWKTIDTDMGNYTFKTFIKLQDDAEPKAIGKRFTALYKAARHGDSETDFTLQPLADMHLVGADGNDAPARMVQIFFIVAILILAIAAINYINLSTASALARAKEVSIRKVVGANRSQLFVQFLAETTLLFCFAILIAIGLIYLLLPVYKLVTNQDLHLSFYDVHIWRIMIYAGLGTLLAASIYPALMLSDFKPLQSIRGEITSGLRTELFRKTLVIFQFSTSMILIVATLVIGRQLHYIRKVNLGYDKSYVLTVPLPNKVVEHIDAVKSELVRQHSIQSVATSGIYDMTNELNASSDLEWSGKPANSQLMIYQAVVDQDFIPTMKMQLLEGANFSGTPADSNRYIVNETAVREMGLKPPYTGQEIRFHGKPGTIIGVVKDFNYQSLKEKIAPLLFYRWWPGNILYVRTDPQHVQQAIEAVEKQYKQYAGVIPFSYHFIDEQFEAKYISDQRTSLLFNLFAGIAVFISCLGLLGLSTYTVRQRVKEIGIRKVLGASVYQIVYLLSKGSLQLVLAAIIIAIPLAWWIMSRWLEDFAYRIDMPWWMFALAGMAAIFFALITICWQAIRAAVANPVKALRNDE